MCRLKFLTICFGVFISLNCLAQEDSLRSYSQKLSVLPPFPKNYFIAIKGNLTIIDNRVLFKADKEKHKKYEFDIPTREIEMAKKWGAFIIPNPWFLPLMIKIKTLDGKKIILTTSKRRRILSLLNEKRPSSR